jgi:hypothetical protein
MVDKKERHRTKEMDGYRHRASGQVVATCALMYLLYTSCPEGDVKMMMLYAGCRFFRYLLEIMEYDVTPKNKGMSHEQKTAYKELWAILKHWETGVCDAIGAAKEPDPDQWK